MNHCGVSDVCALGWDCAEFGKQVGKIHMCWLYASEICFDPHTDYNIWHEGTGWDKIQMNFEPFANESNVIFFVRVEEKKLENHLLHYQSFAALSCVLLLTLNE